MAAEIQYILDKRNVHLLDYSEIVRSNGFLKDEQDLTFYRRKGFFSRLVSGEPTATLELDVQEMLGEHLYFVISMLKRSGFTNVKSIPIKDVGANSSNYLYEVAQITIDGSAAWDAGDSFVQSCEIIITYHDKLEIRLPFGARYFKKANYIAAGDELQELGFTEIYERPIRDLTTGWLKADGSVERITIDGHSDFKKNDGVTYDKKIVIEFHTFKEK